MLLDAEGKRRPASAVPSFAPPAGSAVTGSRRIDRYRASCSSTTSAALAASCSSFDRLALAAFLSSQMLFAGAVFCEAVFFCRRHVTPSWLTSTVVISTGAQRDSERPRIRPTSFTPKPTSSSSPPSLAGSPHDFTSAIPSFAACSPEPCRLLLRPLRRRRSLIGPDLANALPQRIHQVDHLAPRAEPPAHPSAPAGASPSPPPAPSAPPRTRP